MQMVDVRIRKQTVQRCVDGSGRGVQAKSAERVVADHLVFVLHPAIKLLESKQLLLIQSGKTRPLNTAKIAAAPFDPKNFDGSATQCVLLLYFGAGIAPAEVRDARLNPADSS